MSTLKREIAFRHVKGDRWKAVLAHQIGTTKRPGEKFRDLDDFDLMLRHHGGKVTPHFEIEPRWNNS